MDGAQFFFLHVPKTGGTSFRRMLGDVFAADAIYPNEADIEANGGRYLRVEQLSRERCARAKLLVGHLPVVATALFDTPPRTLVIVREPVARALSNLHHIRQRDYPELSLAEVMDAPGVLAGFAANRQTRILSFESIEEAAAGWATMAPDRSRLQRAKEALERCAFVGLTERFADSVKLCERTFGWSFQRRDVTLNISLPIEDDLAPIMARLREAVTLDIELHAFAQRLFERRCAELAK